MTASDEKSVVLGEEDDARLRTALGRVIKLLGGTRVSQERVIGGSQEILTLTLDFPSGRLVIEAETYIGITITGPAELVDRFSRYVNDELVT